MKKDDLLPVVFLVLAPSHNVIVCCQSSSSSWLLPTTSSFAASRLPRPGSFPQRHRFLPASSSSWLLPTTSSFAASRLPRPGSFPQRHRLLPVVAMQKCEGLAESRNFIAIPAASAVFGDKAVENLSPFDTRAFYLLH